MKTKHILIGALLLCATSQVMAQSTNDEIMNQVTAIIKSNSPDADKQVKEIEKANKKDALAIASISKAYLSVKDYTTAKAYADKALVLANKSKDADVKGEVYILLGNIAVGQDDGGTAAQWFQQAIYGNPTNPTGYRRYAQIMSKTDPNGALQTLEDLRKARPDYPVDLIAAEIASGSGKMSEAIKYYDKVNINEMKDYQVSDYATNLFLSKDYEKSLNVATQGHSKWARNASFNRLMMFNQVERKNYDEAIAAGNLLFTASDSAKYSAYDYNYYADAQKGAKNYAAAIETYKKVQAIPDIDAATVAQKNKDIFDCYVKLSDYDNAAIYLKKFTDSQEQKSFSLEELVAQFYADQVTDENTTAEKKKEMYEKADQAYAELAQKYPDNAVYVANKRARLPFSLSATPIEQLTLAAPHYQTIADALSAKSDRSQVETNLLITAYNALTTYHVQVNSDLEKAKEVAAKLIELDPENANAKVILEN